MPCIEGRHDIQVMAHHVLQYVYLAVERYHVCADVNLHLSIEFAFQSRQR